MACIVFTLEDGSTITTPLDVDLITIGRAPDSIVQLACPSVSSHHATVKARSDGYYVQDLSSRNGTRLNGAEIEEGKLSDGDRIGFGDIQAVFYTSDEPPAVPITVAKAEPVAVAIPTPEVKRIVDTAPPVTGIPHGATHYNPRPRGRGAQVQEGSGCMTAIVLLILFGGAFLIGLSLRHYKITDGGILPNDLISKLFSKVKIEVRDDEKK